MINAPLLKTTMKTVKRIDALSAALPETLDLRWNQGSWRTLAIDASDERCKSAMCFAGFTVEVDQAQWLVTSKNIKTLPHAIKTLMDEYVVLASGDSRFDGVVSHRVMTVAQLCDTYGYAVPPEFEAVRHRKTVEARTYARVALGLDHDQAQALFEAENTLEDLQRLVGEFLEEAK